MAKISAFIRLAMSLLLIISGIAKIFNGTTAANMVSSINYGSIASYADSIVLVISIVEVVLGVCILIGYQLITCFRITIFMISAFTIVLLLLPSGDTVDCGCFGDMGGQVGIEVIVARNIILLFMPIVAILIEHKNNTGSTQRRTHKE